MSTYKLKLTSIALIAGMMLSVQNKCYATTNQLIDSVVYFSAGSSTVDPEYMCNYRALRKISENISQHLQSGNIHAIEVMGSSSPSGAVAENYKLAQERAGAVMSFILGLYPSLAHTQQILRAEGESWEELKELVIADRNTPNRSSIIHIIENIPDTIIIETNTSRKKTLMDLGVPTWEYLSEKHFPLLQKGALIAVYNEKQAVNIPSSAITNRAEAAVVSHKDATASIAVEELSPNDFTPQIKKSAINIPISYSYRRKGSSPILAVKSNLLADLLSIINIELEVPLGSRWSIAGEYIFPWWLWESKQYCLQAVCGNIEGRYWLGDRGRKELMTGWFTGIHTGAGYFDIEWGSKGYQGDFFIAAGVSGGYAHKLSKHFRLEYSLGVGYMKTNYREYIPKYGIDGEWHLIRQGSGSLTWIGPTRARVSLVWMINR